MEYWVSEIINTILFVVMMWAWLTILFMVFGQMREVECPFCAGDCQVEYLVNVPDYRYGGESVGKWMDCETCDGRGVIEVDMVDE